MTVKSKCSKLLPFVCGIALMGVSVYFIISKPQIDYVKNALRKEFELVKGRPGFDRIWYELDVYFRVHIFDVTNPDEVMEGATPVFQERGPYVYDMYIKKDVLSTDVETDEINYLTTRTYHFNRELSRGSEDDVVTIINSGYVGTISTIISAFPSFLKKLGNDIHKLFPGMEDLFIREKVGNILFYGLPMECDVNKYKELKLICGFLMGKKPPVIKDTDVEGVYVWSYFERLNGTAQGPLSVNRGVKNKSLLGDTMSFKGKRVQKFWKSDDCNKVKGTDSITWAPMDEKLDYLLTYETQICRWARVDFKRDVVLNGMLGWRYELGKDSWQQEEMECYCPRVKKQPVCPISGVMDLTPCQEAPIYFSEPHFLHGDPSLLEYAKGLNPNEEAHATHITIEPWSGAPLSGSKKLQLNAKLINSPVVHFLANVTEGYFPILWVEEAKDADLDALAGIIQAHRLTKLLNYMTMVPMIAGIYVILRTIYLSLPNEGSRTRVRTFESLNSVLVRQNPQIERNERSVTRRRRTTRVRDIPWN